MNENTISQSLQRGARWRKRGWLAPDSLERAVGDLFDPDAHKRPGSDSSKGRKPRPFVKADGRSYKVINSHGRAVKRFSSMGRAQAYMNKNWNKLREGFGDEAYVAEKDNEVQAARAQLFKIAKYAIRLHQMLGKIDPNTDLEAWVQTKIATCSQMIGEVYHHLDYENATSSVIPTATESQKSISNKQSVSETTDEYKSKLEDMLEAKKKGFDSRKDHMTVVQRDPFVKARARPGAGSHGDKKKAQSKKVTRGKVDVE